MRPDVRSFQQIAEHQLAVCDLLVTERSLVCCPVFIGNALMLYSAVDPVCLVSHTRPRRRPCSSVAAGVGRGHNDRQWYTVAKQHPLTDDTAACHFPRIVNGDNTH
jgi:hypothetical protein